MTDLDQAVLTQESESGRAPAMGDVGTVVAATVVALGGWLVWQVAGIPVVVLGSMWAASYADDGSAAGIWSEGFVVLLAGVTTASFLRLIETIEELRRTREELARVAVAEERERFSRDLHDLLGHTCR